MTKEERVSFLQSTCETFEKQIVELTKRVAGGERAAAGTLHDAELSLHRHQHEFNELRQTR